MNYTQLYTVLHKNFNLSCKAAGFVADNLLKKYEPTHQLGSSARRHTSEHGEKGSDKAQAVLASLEKYTRELLQRGFKLLEEHNIAEQELFAAKIKLKDAKAKCAAFKRQPMTEAEEQAALESAGAEWWEREGKYEAELEERGEYKYFIYEVNRVRETEGRELSAREYCYGGRA